MSKLLLELLLTQAWQILFVASVVLIICRVFAKNRPHLAHILWAIVLIKCLVPPIISSPIGPFSWLTSQIFALPDHHTESLSSNWKTQSSINLQVLELGDLPSRNESLKDNVSQSGLQLTSTICVPTLVLLAWAGSILVLLLRNVIQLWRFQSRLKHCAEPVSPEVVAMMRELSTVLKLKRPVRMFVVNEPIGPAAMGLFSPTILLPQCAIEKLSNEELKALIAHELIHVRRGDLAWAFLQMIAGCFWWFHPMIRFANQRLTDECERSCDEETVFSLRCSPTTYSKCLLKILEWKHELHSSPALPGVRSVQITMDRMERIMNFQRGYDRSPRFLWAIMFSMLAFFLPGAQLSSARQETEKTTETNSPIPQQSATESNVELRQNPTQSDSDLVMKVHDVSDLVQLYAKQAKVDDSKASEAIQSMLTIYEQSARVVDKAIYATPVSAPLPSPVPVKPAGQFLLENGKMTSMTSKENQEILATRIEGYRQFGFSSVILHADFYSSHLQVDFQGADWQKGDTFEWAILTNEQASALTKYQRSSQQMIRLSSPKLLVLNGNQGTVSVGTQHSLKLSEVDRVIHASATKNQDDSIVETGIRMELLPIITANADAIRLSVKLKYDELWSPLANVTKRPALLSMAAAANPTIRLNQSLMIRCSASHPSDANKGRCLAAILHCQIVTPSSLGEKLATSLQTDDNDDSRSIKELPEVIVTPKFEDSSEIMRSHSVPADEPIRRKKRNDISHFQKYEDGREEHRHGIAC